MATEAEADINSAAPAAEAPSIRDALTSAFAADAAAAPAGANSEPPAAKAPKAPAADGNAQEKQGREADGRFAAASKEGQNPKSETSAASPAAEAGSNQTIRPPASWSATAKSEFDKLPPVIQQEVLKREGEINAGMAQWDQKGQRLNRLDQVLAPRQERLRLAGIDEVQALQVLFAAQDMLESPDPRTRAAAIQHLARQSGVDLRSLVGSPAAQQPGQQAQPAPAALDTLMREVASLKQGFTQQQQAVHQQSVSETQKQIETFAADPTNRYFANVRADMGRLIAAGQATSLKDAYDQACWANPEIRGLLIKEQQAVGIAEQERQQRERAAAARRASGSVTGSPAPGSAQVRTGPAKSIREALQDNWDALS